MSDNAIEVKNLGKEFMLPHHRKNTLKSFFVNPFKRQIIEKQTAFSNLNFEIKKGEFFGIVGRNGSGKSTLLKCIAGVYTPDAGRIVIDGTLVPFIELGVGFNPELSGKDNVYLNGALLGFNRKEVSEMYKEIVRFAELEKFMDQALKNYSSGMQVRLAFSIAIRAKSDILLLDEVLAVGDSAFQQKCFDYFQSLKTEHKTIVLVSHNMQAVERFCDRALMLENGVIKKIGTSSEIGAMYENMFLREEVQKTSKKKHEPFQSPLKIHKVELYQEKKKVNEIKAFKDFEVKIVIESKKNLKMANIGMNIKNQDRQSIVETDTQIKLGTVSLPKEKRRTVTFSIKNILTNGLYTINIGVADCSGNTKIDKVIFREDNVKQFIVNGVKYHLNSLVKVDADVVVD